MIVAVAFILFSHHVAPQDDVMTHPSSYPTDGAPATHRAAAADAGDGSGGGGSREAPLHLTALLPGSDVGAARDGWKALETDDEGDAMRQVVCSSDMEADVELSEDDARRRRSPTRLGRSWF